MNLRVIAVLSLFALVGAACRSENKSESTTELASLSLQPLEAVDYKKARLTVVDEAGGKQLIDLLAPQLTIDRAFAPGNYTFSLELFGDTELDLLASTNLDPCKAVSKTLQSGSNVLTIPVCNAKGSVIKPAEKADLKIDIVLVDRPLYAAYTLACANPSGSFNGARSGQDQKLTGSFSPASFDIAEANVVGDRHILKATAGLATVEIKAQIDAAQSILSRVDLVFTPASGPAVSLLFGGWECSLTAIADGGPKIPGGFPSWEAINTADPEKTAAVIFDGIDPVAESFGDDARCSVYIMASYTDEKSVETHLMRTSFAHNGHSHPFVRIGLSDPVAINLIGKSDSGQDEMRLTLQQAGAMSRLSSARVRWFHSDHYHNDVCERLVRRQTSP